MATFSTISRVVDFAAYRGFTDIPRVPTGAATPPLTLRRFAPQRKLMIRLTTANQLRAACRATKPADAVGRREAPEAPSHAAAARQLDSLVSRLLVFFSARLPGDVDYPHCRQASPLPPIWTPAED